MAKKITRTFVGTKVVFLAMDVETGNQITDVKVFTGSPKKDNPKTYYINKLRRELETDTFKIVTIKDIETIEELRGMSPDEFYAHSEPMPEEQEKRNARKPEKENVRK